MRTPADDHRTGITRRTVLQAGGLALASRFASIASAFFDWLTRMFSIDGNVRFA